MHMTTSNSRILSYSKSALFKISALKWTLLFQHEETYRLKKKSENTLYDIQQSMLKKCPNFLDNNIFLEQTLPQ